MTPRTHCPSHGGVFISRDASVLSSESRRGLRGVEGDLRGAERLPHTPREAGRGRSRGVAFPSGQGRVAYWPSSGSVLLECAQAGATVPTEDMEAAFFTRP